MNLNLFDLILWLDIILLYFDPGKVYSRDYHSISVKGILRGKIEELQNMEADQLFLEVVQMDEITFWSRQLGEQALFIAKGIEAAFDELVTLGLENLIDDGRRISELWLGIFRHLRDGKDFPQEEFQEALQILRDYLHQVDELVNATWVGYNFPSQIIQYLKKLEYVQRRFDGEEIPRGELLSFWITIHKDHAALLSRLLDPDDKEVFQQSLLYHQLFEDAIVDLSTEEPVTDRYVILSRIISDFNTFIATLRERQTIGHLKSVLHPRLALHIYREGLRSLIVLKL